MSEHTNFPAPRKPAPLEGQAPLTYKGQPVLTTELAAKAFGAEKALRNNFDRNEGRFEEGKHFYRVEGAELRALKDSTSFRGSVGANARTLTLWTERGIARHAKILDTDTAWAIFEALEDTYFKVRQERRAETTTPLRQPQPKEIRLTHAYYMKLAAAAGLDTNSALISTNRIVRRLTGFDVMGEMEIPALAAPINEALLIPTEIGARLDGIKAQAVNQMLCRFGYQVRMVSAKGDATWELTEMGKAAGGRYLDTERRHSDGTIIGQIKWPASIVDRLRADLLGEAQ